MESRNDSAADLTPHLHDLWHPRSSHGAAWSGIRLSQRRNSWRTIWHLVRSTSVAGMHGDSIHHSGAVRSEGEISARRRKKDLRLGLGSISGSEIARLLRYTTKRSEV